MRIALVADSPISAIRRPLTTELNGLNIQPKYTVFDNADSGYGRIGVSLHDLQPNLVVMFVDPKKIMPDLFSAKTLMGSLELKKSICNAAVSTVVERVSAIRTGFAGTIILCDIHSPMRSPLGIEDSAVELGMFEAIDSVNRGILEGVRSLPRVRVLSLSRVAASVGTAAFDDIVGSMTGQYFSGAMFTAISGEIGRHVSAMWAKKRNVLVIDPDGLIWKQGAADQGASGLTLNGDTRDRVYINFQQACVDLVARGVKLAMISRTNREDVEDIFNNHPDMVLRTKDFAVMECSWSDKPSLIRSVADRMNVDIADVIYADASANDGDWVARNLNEIQLFSPSHPAKAANELREVTSLEGDRLFAIGEPPAPYAAWADSNSKSVIEGVHDYLDTLETKVIIGESLRSEMISVVSSVQRVGAVDLTGNRLDMETISDASGHPNARLFWVRVEDRFGSDGLAGVALVHCSADSWTMHGLLLAESVLDRGVDASVIASLAELARESMAREMIVQCGESGRGAAFSGIGLDEVGYSENGGTRFRAHLVGENTTQIWRPSYVHCTTIVDMNSVAVAA